MKKFKFLVELVEEFADEIEIEAENEKEAIKKLKIELEEEPLSERKNTYEGSEQYISLNGKMI